MHHDHEVSHDHNAQNTKQKYSYPRDMKLKCISIMMYVMIIVHRRPNYIKFVLKRHEVEVHQYHEICHDDHARNTETS